MAQAAPTKGALTAAKHSHALAETGYELMDRAERLQSQIDDAFAEAYASMRLAEISTGGSAAAARSIRAEYLSLIFVS